MTPRTSWIGLLGASAFALLVFAGSASAQTGKVTGIVTDQQTGEPLAGVQVFLEGTGRGTLTQDNGRYFLINIPPGTYTLVAQLIGYATVRRQGVEVGIDVTRTVNFEMPSEAVAVEEIVVEAERVPLVKPGQIGAVDAVTAAEIEALPVTNLQGVLALEQGFLEVPQNTDVVSYAEERRGVTPLRIRGGRAAETVVMIDGIPINNFVLGGPAFDVTTEAIEQFDYIRGGFEPQYGNALSGIINIATKEGGTRLAGAIEYQSSKFAGALGSDSDDLLAFDLFEGFLSGPVPGTGERLRFMVAGRNQFGADRVLEFDEQVYSPRDTVRGPDEPHELDVIPGWRAIGYDQERDIFGKLTYYVTPAAKLSATGITYRRARKPFDFDWMWSYFNPLDYVTTREDSAFYERNPRLLQYQDMVQNSYELLRDLYILKWDHTLGRTAYTITGARFDQERITCNVFQGHCLGPVFEDPNFDEAWVGPGPGVYTRTPTAGTDYFYGGEKLTTYTARVDLQSQVSDHHNLQVGAFYSRHDLEYDEWENVGVNDVLVVKQEYESQPWDAALYIQDKIEYDFITVNLGFRFDYGKAGGLFFANPLDPTNGTTALEVCANPSEWQNVRIRTYDADNNQQVTETLSADPSWTSQSCGDPEVRAVAAKIASSDDFHEASIRKQASPRIGINFPVTESASLFFNFGRYSQNPILRNLYTFTGIGTPAEGTVQGPGLFGSAYSSPFLGNPNLLTEQTTSYEVGYLQEIDQTYALSFILFSKDQARLTGVRGVGRSPYAIFDPGATYGSNAPKYTILVNGDFGTTRGFELSLRRRVRDHWGFDINYSFSQARMNAADPTREREALDDEGDPELRQETRSEVDQPHVFNGVLRFEVGDEPPDIPFGEWLRNFRTSVVLRAASGLPYTPTLDYFGFGSSNQLDRYSGRAPSTFQIDLQAGKDFRVGNVRYGLFMRVRNLTDRRNCIQVYPTTGDCGSGTEDQNRRRAGNASDVRSSTFFDRPQYYGSRRSINAGIRVSW